MKNIKTLVVIILILMFFLFGISTSGITQQKKISLSLEGCITEAMKNNLNVAIEVISPELATHSLSKAREKFLPDLSLGYNTQNTNSASFSWIDAAGTDAITTEFNDYSAQINQTIPTGGQFSVSIYSYMNESNRKFQTINPRFGSSLSFNFFQPLLKDFGLGITRKEIRIAQNNMDISDNQLKSVLLNTIYSVEEAYWNLVYSIENLKVMNQSLKLAQDLLTKSKREAEVGTAAPIEILSAQAEVATREADILQAETLVRSNEDLLSTIINIKADDKKSTMNIIPVDKPVYEEREVNLEEALLIALQNRPDLKASEISVENKRIDLKYAKNQLLPDLSVFASYWSPGISGTQILYQDDNPLSDVVVGTIPGKFADSLVDALKFKYKNWAVGVTLSVPLNSIFSRADYALAKAALEQTVLQLQNQEQQIFLEIRNAVRGVQTNYKRVLAYKIARELAEKKLEAEQKKLKVGLSTNYIALQYQRDLANAQSAELRAIIDYNLSLASLDKALGITLESRNVKLTN